MATSLRQKQKVFTGGAHTASPAQQAITLVSNPIAGDLLVCSVIYNDASAGEATTRAVADNTGTNAWLEAIHGYNTTSQLGFSIWYCLSAAAAPTTITSTLTKSAAGFDTELDVLDFTGTTGWSGTDGSNSTLNSTGVTNPTCGSYSMAHATDVTIALFIGNNSVGTPTAGTGFTLGNTYTLNDFGAVGDEYQLSGSVGTINPSLTIATSAAYTAVAVSFFVGTGTGTHTLAMMGWGT